MTYPNHPKNDMLKIKWEKFVYWQNFPYRKDADNMAGSTAAGDMTQGNPTRLLIRFAIPMMIGGIFQLMYNMVDTIVLGRFVGANALASIGATSSTTSCFLFLSTGMTGGISIVVSQLIGAGEPERVRKASANALLLTAFFGAAIGLIAFIGAQPLMQLLGTPADIIDGAVTYIQITCGLIIVQVAYNAIASVLKAIGDSRTPLYFLILCSFLNIVLDLFFVLTLKMAVAGVAWATIISQGIAAVLSFIYMRRKYAILCFSRQEMAVDRKIMSDYLRYGLPMGATSCLLSVGMLVITSVINSFGSSVVAAYTVGSKVENIAVLLFNQFAMSFSVYAGQNFGAGYRDRIYSGIKQAMRLILILSFIAAVLMLVFGRYFSMLFVDGSETEILSISIWMIRIEACFYPALGLIWLFNSALRGLGQVNVTIVSSIVELLSKILISVLLSRVLGPVGIWFAAPIGWVLGGIVSGTAFYRGRWEKRLPPPKTAENAKCESHH